MLEEYELTKSFFDDPILKTYEAEFITNFGLTDADIKPFNVSQLIQFDDFLDQVATRLIGMSDENNREELETIVAEITYVRDNLSSRSQKWVVENISKIFSKIAKQGMKFMKEFWSEGKKELIKTIVKGAIESGTDLLN